MLDITIVREQTEAVRKSITRRGQIEKLDLVDEVIAKHDDWKQAKSILDELRRQRNELSEEINKAKKAGKDAMDIIKKARELPAQIKEAEELEEMLSARIDEILRTLPNILHHDVPDGDSEEDNVERKKFGEAPKFSFDVKSHVEIAENLGIADFESARTVAGAGFFFLKGDLALLDLALQRYALDIMVEKGFTAVIPPHMTRHEIAAGMTDLAFFDETMFKIEGEDLYPIPTSEFPLVGMLFGTDTDVRKLPVTLCGISPCYRKELGAHGIDEKGLFRTHQFNKIEQVVVCTPDESEQWYDKLLGITTEIFTGLGLHTRILEMCTADIGDLKFRQADVEVWSPRKEGFIEVGSCSNLTTCQARRLGIRYMQPDGTRGYAHTLNNTALATSRAMVAILENFQQEDGSVNIPEVLQKYMYGKKVISA